LICSFRLAAVIHVAGAMRQPITPDFVAPDDSQ
jgi:hypothetical protein